MLKEILGYFFLGIGFIASAILTRKLIYHYIPKFTLGNQKEKLVEYENIIYSLFFLFMGTIDFLLFLNLTTKSTIFSLAKNILLITTLVLILNTLFGLLFSEIIRDSTKKLTITSFIISVFIVSIILYLV